MWLFLVGAFFLSFSPLGLADQDRYEVRARTFVKGGGSSSVLLLDMVHFGPAQYYRDLSQELGHYAKDKQNIAVLMEGVACGQDTLSLRDQLQRWPFPTLQELKRNFTPVELATLTSGQLSFKIYQFFRSTFTRNIEQHGLAYYFETKSCGTLNVAQRETAQASPSQLQGLDDFYTQTADRMSKQSGIPSLTQGDQYNPLWTQLRSLSQRGQIRAIVRSDIDQSSLDTRDFDQVLWLARMSIHENQMPLLNPAFAYLNGIWYAVNQRGFRNQIVMDNLRIGLERGHQHFVLPWGEAHNQDLAKRLLELGYHATEEVKVPYASCQYVQLAVANTSCKISL